MDFKEYFKILTKIEKQAYFKSDQIKNSHLKSSFNASNNLPILDTSSIVRKGLQDNSGVVYQFDRGVIGISVDGELKKIVLDGTDNHHFGAIKALGIEFNCKTTDKLAGLYTIYQFGIKLSNDGIVVICLEGQSMIIFLPDKLSKEQHDKLLAEVEPRLIRNFIIGFSCLGVDYDSYNFNFANFKEFIDKITDFNLKLSNKTK